MKALLLHKLRDLAHGESGVALAYSVTVMLLLYIPMLATYGLGDVIQKRVCLQNAADSAAYTGAVVQADTLSRIAVINKAMAWTYVMQTRVDMDYIVNKWIGYVVSTWDVANCVVKAINAGSCCGNVIAGRNYFAGSPRRHGRIHFEPLEHGRIHFEPLEKDLMIGGIRREYCCEFPMYLTGKEGQMRTATSANAGKISEKMTDEKLEKIVENRHKEALAGDGSDGSKTGGTNGSRQLTGDQQQEMEDNIANDVKDLIKDYLAIGISSAIGNGMCKVLAKHSTSLGNNLKAMNRAERELVENLDTRVRDAMTKTLEVNAPNAKWAFQVAQGGQYLERMASSASNERRFIGFASEFYNRRPASASVFGRGADNWMNFKGGKEGMRRNYGVDSLRASWSNYSERWALVPVGLGTACVPIFIFPLVQTTVTAGMFRDSYYTTANACPYVIKNEFFSRDGAITVAVSEPLSNPYGAFIGDVSRGVFSLFTVGGGSQKICAVASSRAGYRLGGWATGEYQNSGAIQDRWNLCVGDWDGALLPLNDSNVLLPSRFASLLSEVGCGTQFVPAPNRKAYSTIDYRRAIGHVYH